MKVLTRFDEPELDLLCVDERHRKQERHRGQCVQQVRCGRDVAPEIAQEATRTHLSTSFRRRLNVEVMQDVVTTQTRAVVAVTTDLEEGAECDDGQTHGADDDEADVRVQLSHWLVISRPRQSVVAATALHTSVDEEGLRDQHERRVTPQPQRVDAQLPTTTELQSPVRHVDVKK